MWRGVVCWLTATVVVAVRLWLLLAIRINYRPDRIDCSQAHSSDNTDKLTTHSCLFLDSHHVLRAHPAQFCLVP